MVHGIVHMILSNVTTSCDAENETHQNKDVVSDILLFW